MKVLVVNAGSSSVKFQIYETDGEQCLAKGMVERIGEEEPNFKVKCENGYSVEESVPAKNHREALEIACHRMVEDGCNVLNSLNEIDAVGHRVVHGGEKFSDSAIVTDEVIEAIEECTPLAPLHNPPNLSGIKAAMDLFPGTANIAVFDTAFHQTMPDYSYMYAVPREFYHNFGIRKYGFHGTSHKYVTQVTSEYLGKSVSETKLITCHLGNGCSVAAVNGGNVLDTSMGLTPLSGLVMGTRCGDIDPGVVFHLLSNGYSAEEVDKTLNKKSGLLGVGGVDSNDMRDIISGVKDDVQEADCALNMYVHRLVHYIGGYYALLEGADAIVLTGGVGENSLLFRERLMQRLGGLDVTFDPSKNEEKGVQTEISASDSALKVVVMPTNEELMIARETLRLQSECCETAVN